MIEVTMTATWRPELIERTFKSFHDNLWKSMPPRKLIINIDPVGADRDKSGDIIEICTEYFEEIQVNRPKIAHFPTAFIWCWKQVKRQFIFHLEEDWELLYPMNWLQMIKLMASPNLNLAHLRFSIFKSTEETCKNWSNFYNWVGGYFECPEEHKGSIGWCGHPSLNNGWFVRRVVEFLDPKYNPEKQIKWRNPMIGPIIKEYNFGSFIPQNSPPNIKDIGREWMSEHRYTKAGGNNEHFTNWEKI